MKQNPETRLRLCLATLPVGGLIGLVGVLLRGPYGTPLGDPAQWANAATSTAFLTAQLAILVGYVLPFLGFWALYRYLQRFDVERSAFWGFVLSLWGTALALPALGIAAFAGPVAANLYQAGQSEAAQLISSALTGTGFYVGITAAICYVLGPAFSAYAIWHSPGLPKGAAFLFALHGLLLSFGFGFFPLLVVGWLCFFISGLWLVTSSSAMVDWQLRKATVRP